MTPLPLFARSESEGEPFEKARSAWKARRFAESTDALDEWGAVRYTFRGERTVRMDEPSTPTESRRSMHWAVAENNGDVLEATELEK